MSDASYDIRVTDGKPDGFNWHLLNEYKNMSPSVAAEVAKAANGVLSAVSKQADPNGELTAVLTATVDGKAMPAQTTKLTQEGLTKAQRQIHRDGDGFIGKTEKHAKDKKAKHGKPTGSTPPGWKPGDPAISG